MDDRGQEAAGAPRLLLLGKAVAARRGAANKMSFFLINKPPLTETDLRYKGEVVFERNLESFFTALRGKPADALAVEGSHCSVPLLCRQPLISAAALWSVWACKARLQACGSGVWRPLLQPWAA